MRRESAAVHQVEDLAFARADDSGMRLAGEIAYRSRMPVVAAGETGFIVQALLHDSPVARGGDSEAVEIDLESVADGVVIDLRRQAAGSD